MFDDVFSGLDAATEDKIFCRLLGQNGLLRRARMSVLAAASTARRAPYADQMNFLSENGQMIEEENSNKHGRRIDMPSNAGYDMSPERSGSQLEATQTSTRLPRSRLQPGAALEARHARQAGDSTVYSYYLKSAGTASVIFFAASMAGYAFFQSFPSLWLSWWTEANEKRPNSGLGKWLGGYAAFGVGAL